MGLHVDDFDVVVLVMLLLLAFVGFACDVLGMNVNLMQHCLPHLTTLGQTCKHLRHCCKQKARVCTSKLGQSTHDRMVGKGRSHASCNKVDGMFNAAVVVVVVVVVVKFQGG